MAVNRRVLLRMKVKPKKIATAHLAALPAAT